MENEQTTTLENVADTAVSASSHDAATTVDELLVEEISIDGMCGVY